MSSTFDMFRFAMEQLDEKWKKENIYQEPHGRMPIANEEEQNVQQGRSPTGSNDSMGLPASSRVIKKVRRTSPAVLNEASLVGVVPTKSSPSAMTKSAIARQEFWSMITFCIENSIPLVGKLAAHDSRQPVMFLSSSGSEETKIVRFEVRMNPAVAALVKKELVNNVIFKMVDLDQTRGVYAFEIDVTESDIIMHVMSQGIRDKPGTQTGPTNCFCTKINGSKFNRKPKDNMLIIPMPDPQLHVARYLRRRDVFTNEGSACELFVHTQYSTHQLRGRLASYDMQTNTFVFMLRDSDASLFEDHGQSSDGSYDAVHKSGPATVEFTSDIALFRETRAHALFNVSVSSADGSRIKGAVHVTLDVSKSLDEASLSSLIASIPQIKPYVPF
jgi:hypothetical protein